jgi:hypothetical protein
LSKQEKVDGFMKNMGSWSDKIAKDEEMVGYGYVDIESVKAVPYGSCFYLGPLDMKWAFRKEE